MSRSRGFIPVSIAEFPTNTLKRVAMAWLLKRMQLAIIWKSQVANSQCILKDTPLPSARQFNPFARSLRRGQLQLLVHRNPWAGCTTGILSNW